MRQRHAGADNRRKGSLALSNRLDQLLQRHRPASLPFEAVSPNEKGRELINGLPAVLGQERSKNMFLLKKFDNAAAVLARLPGLDHRAAHERGAENLIENHGGEHDIGEG